MNKSSFSVKPLVLVALFILTTAALFSIGAVTGYAAEDAKEGLKLCSASGFRGICNTFTESDPNTNQHFGLESIVSSASAPLGKEAYYFICAGENYQWPCTGIYKEDISNLENKKFYLYYLKTYFVDLTQGGPLPGVFATIFVDTFLSLGNHDVKVETSYNDHVQSVMVAPCDEKTRNCEPPAVVFCADTIFRGACFAYKNEGNYADLDKLVLVGPEIGLPVPDTSLEQDRHYFYGSSKMLSSMMIPSGTSVRVWDCNRDRVEFIGGRPLCVEGSSSAGYRVFEGPLTLRDLDSVGWNDRIVGIDVFPTPEGKSAAPATPEAANNPPTLTVTHEPLNPKLGEGVRITAVASDDKLVSGVTIYFDGKKMYSCTQKDNQVTCSQVVKSVAEGEHNYYAIATDSDGLTARTPAAADWKSKSFIVPSSGQAATPPELSVTVTPVSPKLGDTVTIDAIATGVGIEMMEISVDGAAVKTCQDFEKDASGDFRCVYSAAFKVGEHTYSVTAMDSAGAWASYSVEGRATNSFKVLPLGKDAVMPVIEKVYTDPEKVYTDMPFSIVAEASDNVRLSTIDILVDGEKKTCTINAEKGRCSYDFPKGYPSAGTHTYWVYATDASSNLVRDPATGRSPASYTLNILEPTRLGGGADTAAPAIDRIEMTKKADAVGDCTIEAEASDDRVLRKVEIYVNGQMKSWNEFSAVKTGTVKYSEPYGWQSGTYEYYAVAYDLYGNKVQKSGTTFTVSKDENSNCLYVESTCPSGQVKDVKTGMCKLSTGTGWGGILNILGGFVMSPLAKIAAAFT